MKNLVYTSIPGIIRILFLLHCCENKGYYNYKASDFYLVVTESDSSYENLVCNITSKKRIETLEFDNINQNDIIDFMDGYNKNEVTLYCIKCDAKINTS